MPIYQVPTRKAVRPGRLYNDRRWRAASEAWLRQYPFCVLCLVRGQINSGADEYSSSRQRNLVVDHIEPHRGDVDLFWDQTNWQTLCRMPCHDVDKQRHEAKGGTGVEWIAMLRREMQRQHTEADCIDWFPPNISG